MAQKEKDEQIDIKAALADALRSLKPEELSAILRDAGAVPTTQGFDAEMVKAIASAFQSTSATAVRETLRQERVENPNFPERSVFNPRGVFDDQGHPLQPKVKFRRETFYCGVRLGGELETEAEIELFNAFTEDRTAREGLWTAEITKKGTPKERLSIKIPSFSSDDRVANSLPLLLILRELLDGAEAVNPETLQKQIAELQAKVKRLELEQNAQA